MVPGRSSSERAGESRSILETGRSSLGSNGSSRAADYFRSNLIITTTGVCQDSALQCALAELGEDRVLFSVDYPYEVTQETAEWIERAPLTDAQREKICFKNAERVLRLGSATRR